MKVMILHEEIVQKSKSRAKSFCIIFCTIFYLKKNIYYYK